MHKCHIRFSFCLIFEFILFYCRNISESLNWSQKVLGSFRCKTFPSVCDAIAIAEIIRFAWILVQNFDVLCKIICTVLVYIIERTHIEGHIKYLIKVRSMVENSLKSVFISIIEFFMHFASKFYEIYVIRILSRILCLENKCTLSKLLYTRSIT